MKLRTSLAGVGAAMVFALAAQGAEASTIQCPGNGNEGGGEQQVEVGQEDPNCAPAGGYSSVTTSSVDATGAAYTAEVTFEGPDEYLAIGEVVEVEIDADAIIAALRANPKAAVQVAFDIGVRESKSDVVRAANIASAKLTESEYAAVASYIKTAVQARGTGRSDPATNNSTSRLERGIQAFERAVSSLGGAIRNAIMPNIRTGARERIQRPDGTVVQREVYFELS